MSAASLIFERYRYLDHLLSDAAWLPATFEGYILRDLWLAIRQTAEQEGTKVPRIIPRAPKRA